MFSRRSQSTFRDAWLRSQESIGHARQASPNVRSIQKCILWIDRTEISITLPARTRDCERWKWYSPYSRCRYLATGLPSSSLLLFISWLIVFLRSLDVYPSLRSRFLLDSCFSIYCRICTIRETWHCIRRFGDCATFSPTEDHVLSFRFHARKIRRLERPMLCDTPRSATRRKLRSGLLLAVRELAPLLYDRERGSCILCT